MFNLSGTELVFLVVIALVVLGPEKLPEAVRKFARTYGELKKMSTGFQSELRSALDEPMKEMRATADALREAVNIDLKPGNEPAKPAATTDVPVTGTAEMGTTPAAAGVGLTEGQPAVSLPVRPEVPAAPAAALDDGTPDPA